ncbi:MAG TPA: virulence protein RhuM/Fic/DOC family protein [bacterium]|nr:virulence protein RhuM/Fic/DOC family protein [bacterium]
MSESNKILKNKLLVYQTKSGAVEVMINKQKETILLTQQQVANLFDVQKAAISKHVNHIFKTGELEKKSTVSILETVQIEGNRNIKRNVEYYNLDLILSVGYRVNSVSATRFRQWANKILKQHILQGYTINKKRLVKNYDAFLKTIETVKQLLPAKESQVQTGDALELIKMFANTWLSLSAYDQSKLPKSGTSKKVARFTADELSGALKQLKNTLTKKKEASDLFGRERQVDSVGGIVGNVFQGVFGKDVYVSNEEKAANLLYFFVKDHPFADGNKRSGAFAFVWFLNRAGLLKKHKLTPEALTALTLLVAESSSKDKEKMIGLILQLLK